MLQIIRKCRQSIGISRSARTVLLVFLFVQTSVHAQFLPEEVVPGAERTELYLPLLKQKRVGVVANHASFVEKSHLIDTLLAAGIGVVKIFSPEHGFRGEADAGEHLDNEVDQRTGIPIVSLYGDNREPKDEQLEGIDVMVFDLQDVGVRFYTYISTLTYVMKACAKNDVDLIVLDRPNPNGHYIDGPVLEPRFRSFVGLHEVPVIYGMTIGEYARMVKGEDWNATANCRLRVIPLDRYDHNTEYNLPIKPSPNLPNMRSVYLYPSLCFFEGTVVSIGRGTEYPFQIIGHPDFAIGSYIFTPRSGPGSKEPKLKDRACFGLNLTGMTEQDARNLARINLTYLISFYNYLPEKKDFFNNYFNLLAGNATLKQQIIEGKKEAEIRKSWAFDTERFKKIREKYLLYPDFESRIEIGD